MPNWVYVCHHPVWHGLHRMTGERLKTNSSKSRKEHRQHVEAHSGYVRMQSVSLTDGDCLLSNKEQSDGSRLYLTGNNEENTSRQQNHRDNISLRQGKCFD
jgi:hypothetical protein